MSVIERIAFSVSYTCIVIGIHIPYTAGNIGGELYLVDWQFSCHTANIKSANIAPTPGEGVAIVP